MSTSSDDVARRVKEIMLEVVGSKVSAQEIGDEKKLSHLGIESLNVLEIAVRIERVFDIQIDDAEIFEADLTRVGSLVDLVRSHVCS
jgi:acyl carrier protein